MFKRISIVLLVGLFISTPAYAAKRTVNLMHASTKVTVPTVVGTGTTYTRSFPLADTATDQPIGVFARATSDTTVDVALYFEQSYIQPAVEGSIDYRWLSSDLDLSITDSVQYLYTVDTVKGTYGRFRIKGQGSNSNATLIDIRVVK